MAASACIVGKKEGEGPLRDSFDTIIEDSYFGEKTWEKAESTMQKMALQKALEKANLPPTALEFIFAGDLLNQCIGSTFSMRDMGIPFFGLFGACSTMAESLALASMAIDGGFADTAAAITSSHFCTAERQFRFPLEYGGQRTPTAQWTVTGSGAVILTAEGPGPYVKHITCGKIVDAGIKDANNMGAAMAPAAYSTISAHFNDLALRPSDYDLIVTGDLGAMGAEILVDFFKNDGVDISHNYNDCGLMIFSRQEQDVHAGGSGCGCSASVLCGHLLNGMRDGRWKKILFAPTGALLSPTSTQQGESIPSICCAIAISTQK
ncbi:stage V sporulation protein AD [Sporobacter termitidis]|nr:stage V sporulation protein AD [Sporobacter termitidis]